MPHLDRCWSYGGRAYGPGETEIPQGLHDILSERGYLEPEADDLSARYGEQNAELLRENGYGTAASVESASDEDLLAIDGIGPMRLRKIRDA